MATDGDTLLDEMAAYAAQKGWSLAGGEDEQSMDVVFEGKEVRLSITGTPYPLTVGTLQAFLDDWMPAHPETRLDYVHGEAAVAQADGWGKGRWFPAARDAQGFVVSSSGTARLAAA